MIDLYLKASSEGEALRALQFAGLTASNESGEIFITETPGTSVAVLGVLHEKAGTDGVEGEEVPAIPGWHVNIRTRDETVAAALEPLAVAPDTPKVVWAGEPNPSATD